MVCLQGQCSQLLLTTHLLVGGSENQSCFSSNQPQVEPSVEEDKWCVHVLTSHLGTYFYIQSSHPTDEQFVKQNFGDFGDLPLPPSLSSVGLFKSVTVCSLSLLSDHGGSVPGFFLAYNGTTFVDCHSKENQVHLFLLLSFLSC